MANLDLVHRLDRQKASIDHSAPYDENGEVVNDDRVSYKQIIRWYLLIGVPAALGFFFLNVYLVGFGAVSDISVSLGARVMLAYDGAPPRLENIGGIYPPVPFFMSLLLRDQLLATSLVGGFMLAAVFWFIRKLRIMGSINGVVEFASVVYLLFLPQSLYIFTQRIDICLVLLLFCITLLSLRKTHCYGRAYYMTIAGLAMALLFLCDYSAGLVFLLFLPIMILKCLRSGDSATATAMMLYLPLAFFALIQFPMSVLFTGVRDPFLEWHNLLVNAYGMADNAWLSGGELRDLLPFLISRLADKLVFLLPWLAVGVVLLLRKSTRGRTIYLLYFPAPLLYCLSSLGMGYSNFIIDNASYLVFPAVALLLLHHDFSWQTGKERGVTALLLAALAISLAGGYRQAATTQDPMEKKFYAAIWKGEIDQEWQQTSHLVKEVSGFEDTGTILMDSSRNLPLVFISGSPKRFLLPYQLDFEIGLSLPAAYVEYIVVHADSNKDMVAKRYPQALDGRLPGFSLVGEYGPRLLFKRTVTSFSDG